MCNYFLSFQIFQFIFVIYKVIILTFSVYVPKISISFGGGGGELKWKYIFLIHSPEEPREQRLGEVRPQNLSYINFIKDKTTRMFLWYLSANFIRKKFKNLTTRRILRTTSRWSTTRNIEIEIKCKKSS